MTAGVAWPLGKDARYLDTQIYPLWLAALILDMVPGNGGRM